MYMIIGLCASNSIIIAECFSARKLILHRILRSIVMYACMYVCMYIRTCHTWECNLHGGPFLVHLAYYSGMDNEDDKERIRRLATLDTHGRLPTSDLAVEVTMTLAFLETAVTMQCTLAFMETVD